MSNILLPKPALGTPLYTGHTLARGIQANYLFNDGAGDKLRDSSNYGNHGTITGATWVGDGLSFNGSSDFATVPQQLLGVKTFTVIVWAKATDGSAGDEIILEYTSNANSGGFHINYRDPTVDILIRSVAGGTTTGWQTDSLTVGKWTQLAFTADFNLASGELVGYFDGLVNGLLTVDGNNTGSLSTDTLYVGSRGGSSLWFGGSISYAVIYNRVLSSTEIRQLYIYQRNLLFPDPNEIALRGGFVAAAGVTIPVMIHHYKQAGGL